MINHLKVLVQLSFILITLFSVAAHAKNIASLSDDDKPESLGQYLEYIDDPTLSITFDDIMQLDKNTSSGSLNASKIAWQKVNNESINGGFTKSAYWVKFSIKNNTNKSIDWILESAYPLLDRIEFYQPDANNNYSKEIAGDHISFKERHISYRNPTFILKSPPTKIQTFYLRVTSESSLNINLKKWPRQSFSEVISSEALAFGLFYGIMLITAFYNMMSALFLRDKAYLWVGISLTSATLYFASLNGLAFQYLWPENLWLQTFGLPFFMNMAFLFILIYSQHFLDLKNKAPIWYKILKFDAYIIISLALLIPFVSYNIIIKLDTLISLLSSFLCLFAGISELIKGNKVARYYCVGWVLLLFGLTVFALKTTGHIQSSLITIWGQEFCFTALGVFLTIAQSDRVYQMKKAHEAQQRDSIEAIQGAEKKYRSLFENAIEGIFQMDQQGLLLNANNAFAQIVGEDNIQTLLGDKTQAYTLGFLATNEAEKLEAILKSKENIAEFKTSYDDKNNDTRWASISIQKVMHEGSDDFHYEGSIANITETKKREQAEKQSRMAEASTEAKSLFLANMSHEIRTPMNAIIGFTELAMSSDDTHKHGEFLRKIKMASTNLLGIINDILDFSKIEAGKLNIEYTPFSISELMENLRNMVASNVESKGLTFSIDVDKDIPDLLIGDSLRVHQVLVNLTNNAVKFTQEGSVSIEMDLIELDKSNGTIEIEGRVIDTGIGISEEKQKTLFSSFTQADESTTRQFGGTGLGLSISKQLIEMMDGKVGIKSKEGQGSSFEFTFKCRLESRKKRAKSNLNNGSLNILIVDDQPDSRQLLQSVIHSLNHVCTIVTNCMMMQSQHFNYKKKLTFLLT